MIARVDHLVYAAPDVDAAVDDLAARLGVRATAGGKHDGRGTRNALIALGPRTYLEIVGPDASQPPSPIPRWFSIDTLERPRLVTWAARTIDLPRFVAADPKRASLLGPVMTGSRRRPDGVTLSWSLTDPLRMTEDGVVPFLIDWGSSPHPAESAASGASLIDLRVEHPAPETVHDAFTALGVDLVVTRAASPALIATLRTPRGDVELR